jgi:hypothetical protein
MQTATPENVKQIGGYVTGAVPKRERGMAKGLTRAKRKRVLQIMYRMFGNRVREWANFLRRPESTVRSWRDGGAIPYHWEAILRSMGIDPDWLDLPEDLWIKFLETVPKDALPPICFRYLEQSKLDQPSLSRRRTAKTTLLPATSLTLPGPTSIAGSTISTSS